MALWTFNARPDVLHSYVPVDDAERSRARATGATARRGSTTPGAMRWPPTWRTRSGCATAAPPAAASWWSSPTARTSARSAPPDSARGSRRICSRRSSSSSPSSASAMTSTSARWPGDGRARRLRRRAEGRAPSELRKLFQMVSQSAIRASQGRIQPGASAGFFSP